MSCSTRWCASHARLSIVIVCCRVTPSTAGPSRTVAASIAASNPGSRQSSIAPRHAGRATASPPSNPVRHPSQDQMRRRRDAGDILAVRDMRPDQRTRQRPHADLIAAIANRDRVPRPGHEKIVQQHRIGPNIVPTHVARRAICGPAAALDRQRQPHIRRAPHRNDGVDRPTERHHVDRHVGHPRQRRAARRRAKLVGAHPAQNANPSERMRQQRRTNRPVGFRGRRHAARHIEPGDQPNRSARVSQRCHRAAQTPACRGKQRRDIAPDILLDDRLDRVNQRRAVHAKVVASTSRCVYRAASLVLRRSVISMLPGAWVMQNSGFTEATTDCGVTPHAQNTGSSSAPTGTASP